MREVRKRLLLRRLGKKWSHGFSVRLERELESRVWLSGHQQIVSVFLLREQEGSIHINLHLHEFVLEREADPPFAKVA
jgi:hypothetical protein